MPDHNQDSYNALGRFLFVDKHPELLDDTLFEYEKYAARMYASVAEIPLKRAQGIIHVISTRTLPPTASHISYLESVIREKFTDRPVSYSEVFMGKLRKALNEVTGSRDETATLAQTPLPAASRPDRTDYITRPHGSPEQR
jgi:hypothetical protein